MKRLLFAALTVAVVVGAVIHAQDPQSVQDRPPVRNSFVMGQIVDADGSPVRSAVVTLSGGLAQISLTTAVARDLVGGARKTLTDGEGRFVFADLEAGSYTIDATKAGYLPGAYGRRRHGGSGQSLVLSEGERRTDVRIPVWEFVAITGSVNDEAGEPMVGVQVTAQRQGFIATRPRLAPPSAVAVTDDRGIYRIDGLPPGNYVVCVPTAQVSVPSALADLYLQLRAGVPGAAKLPADVMQQLNTPEFRIASTGVLSGRQFGDVLLQTGSRMPVLPPDTGGRLAAYTTRCYPDATPADAERLTLESGAERSEINFNLRPVPVASVEGSLVAPVGSVANVAVRLVPPYASSLAVDTGAETSIAFTDATGRFHFPAVPVGEYALKVLRAPLDPGPNNQSGAPMPSTEPTGWADMPISVGEKGITGLEVPLRGGFRLTGRLVLEGTSANKPGPDLIEKFSMQLDPAAGHGSRMPPAFRGTIDREGRITTNEIPPGRYVVLFLAFASERLAMQGWEHVGATINGRDVSHTPFELNSDVNTLVMTLSDHAAEISGTVRDPQGNADPGGAVLLFPTDRSRWTDRGFSTRAMRLQRAGQTGAYRLGSVPPGEYFIVALPDEHAGDWENPEVLVAAMRSATRVSIALKQKKTVDLVTTPLRGIGR